MLFNLLADSVSTTESANNNGGTTVMWIVLIVLVIAIMVFNMFTSKKRRAQMEAEKEKRNAIKPGFKVMTIGGIVGTVVSVDDEANTFVLQTGSDENPNCIKFDKVAIYSSEDPNEESTKAAEDEDILPVSTENVEGAVQENENADVENQNGDAENQN